MLNKKAGTEGITWVGGLVAILMIVAVSIVAYKVSSLGEKNPINISAISDSSSFYRVAAYALSSDFNSTEKGKILHDFYYDTRQIAMSIGLEGYPSVSRLGFSFIVYSYDPLFKFYTGFYLSCRACLPNKYLGVTYSREATNVFKP